MEELKDEVLVGEIISRLPLKLAVQCKVLSKDLKRMISDPQSSQTLYQHHKNTSTQLIYSINGSSFRTHYKITTNPTITLTQSVLTLPYEVEIWASCNGLILFCFEQFMLYCVFNPVTGEHQLIPYPEAFPNGVANFGLAVDYPNSDQYKVVTISKLVENSDLFYKFHVLSSERPGLWHEIQLRTNTFISLSFGSPSVYWHDTLYCLRTDGSALAFDTSREEAKLIDRPEFLDHFDVSHGKIETGQDVWLGMAQDVLTLVCIFRKCIVIGTYDSAGSRWRVSHTVNNFISNQDGIIIGLPVWIDSKQVSFLVERPRTQYHDLYEYNTQINVFENNAAVLGIVTYPMYCFHPTLASVHRTPPNNVSTADQAYIAAKLDDIRRFIIEGISIQEESSSGESSSSEEEEEEEAESEEEEEEEAGGGEVAAGGGGGGEEEAAGAGAGGGGEEEAAGGEGEELL